MLASARNRLRWFSRFGLFVTNSLCCAARTVSVAAVRLVMRRERVHGGNAPCHVTQALNLRVVQRKGSCKHAALGQRGMQCQFRALLRAPRRVLLDSLD